jgi:hypothetical protein
MFSDVVLDKKSVKTVLFLYVVLSGALGASYFFNSWIVLGALAIIAIMTEVIYSKVVNIECRIQKVERFLQQNYFNRFLYAIVFQAVPFVFGILIVAKERFDFSNSAIVIAYVSAIVLIFALISAMFLPMTSKKRLKKLKIKLEKNSTMTK